MADSRNYLDDEDDISRFIEECLVRDGTALTAMSNIYPVFKAWQEAQGVRLWTQNAMTRALGEEGVIEIKRARPSPNGPFVNCAVGVKPR